MNLGHIWATSTMSHQQNSNSVHRRLRNTNIRSRTLYLIMPPSIIAMIRFAAPRSHPSIGRGIALCCDDKRTYARATFVHVYTYVFSMIWVRCGVRALVCPRNILSPSVFGFDSAFVCRAAKKADALFAIP